MWGAYRCLVEKLSERVKRGQGWLEQQPTARETKSVGVSRHWGMWDCRAAETGNSSLFREPFGVSLASRRYASCSQLQPKASCYWPTAEENVVQVLSFAHGSFGLFLPQPRRLA